MATPKQLGRHVLTVLQQLEPGVSKRAKELGAKCTKDCAACCYQIVGIVFAEAIAIADHVVTTWPAAEVDELQRVMDERTEMMARRRSTTEQFLEQRPCPFLAPSTAPWSGTCRIYQVRPSTCRFQYVVSDPAFCAPERVYEAHLVDTRLVSVQAVEAMACGSAALAAYGPLPAYVAMAIRMVRENVEPALLDLIGWTNRMQQWAAHDRAVQEKTGKEDNYI